MRIRFLNNIYNLLLFLLKEVILNVSLIPPLSLLISTDEVNINLNIKRRLVSVSTSPLPPFPLPPPLWGLGTGLEAG